MEKSVSTLISEAFIAEINKYKDIDVVQQNSAGKRPNFPYITIDVSDSFIQNTFSPLSDHFNSRIQVKAVSDDRNECGALSDFIRTKFFDQQPTADLAEKGIGVINMEPNPATSTNLDTYFVYEDSWSFMLNIFNHHEDDTQGKDLSDANLKFRGND